MKLITYIHRLIKRKESIPLKYTLVFKCVVGYKKSRGEIVISNN